MLTLKLVGGVVDTDRDMRLLAAHLKGIVPPSPFEVVCVDLRCEGLAFYLGGAVERVRTCSTSYPVFGDTEPLDDELSELPEASHYHILVYKADNDSQLRQLIGQHLESKLCSDESIPLPHDRRAIVCRAARNVGPAIAPEVHQLGREVPTP